MASYYYEQHRNDADYASIELNGMAGDELAGGLDDLAFGAGFGASAWSHAPARSGKRDSRDKVALVLAGGGITGAVYEVGALRAIDDLLVGLTVNDFDIFVGTSAGALVNSFIANGFTPREVMQLIDNRHPELHGIGVQDAYRLNFEDALRHVGRLPNVAWSVTRSVFTNFRDLAVADLLWEMAQLLPSGIYNGDALDAYVRSVLEKPGFVNSFTQLNNDLFLVASELDSGARAVFGRGYMEDVPISRAVAASSAVPVLYRPVQIFEKDYLDGSLHGNASLDLAIEAGAKLVVCVNSMVPFDASVVRPNEHYIRRRGLQGVINQSVRTLLHASLRYHIKNLRVKYPDVDVILIQPGLDDYEMFSHNPMHYSGRLAVAQHGFETVTMGLLHNIDYYRAVLARHDIPLHTDLLEAEISALHSGRATHLGIVDDLIVESNAPPTLLDSVRHLEQSMARLRSHVESSHVGNGAGSVRRVKIDD
jgi:predicted acylesterase/phospholipase RssA